MTFAASCIASAAASCGDLPCASPVSRPAAKLSPAAVVALLSVSVTIGLAPFAAAVWVTPTWSDLAVLFGVACFATGGHYAMTLAFAAAPVTVTQPVTFLQLVWSVMVGAIFFAEPADPFVVAGGLLIALAFALGGIYVYDDAHKGTLGWVLFQVGAKAGFALMLHKPLGVTCSHKEAGELVYDRLPARWRRRKPAISTIGRLDKQTTGLLLLTDDGDLLHRISSPRSRLRKTYRATLARPLDGTETALFASGRLTLRGDDKPLAPAVLEIISETEALITVTEGRYHQVRRMFAATGNFVEALRRERLGDLCLHDTLAPGRWKLLSKEEIALVFR